LTGTRPLSLPTTLKSAASPVRGRAGFLDEGVDVEADAVVVDGPPLAVEEEARRAARAGDQGGVGVHGPAAARGQAAARRETAARRIQRVGSSIRECVKRPPLCGGGLFARPLVFFREACAFFTNATPSTHSTHTSHTMSASPPPQAVDAAPMAEGGR